MYWKKLDFIKLNNKKIKKEVAIFVASLFFKIKNVGENKT